MSDTKAWVTFFEESGIPTKLAIQYAMTFVDNRITRAMLGDLSKEILKDVGITAIGDVICILKHARNCCEEELTSQVLSRIGSSESKQKQPISVKTSKSAQPSDSPLAKRRYVPPDADVPYTVKMPSNAVKASRQLVQAAVKTQQNKSVFSRLGESAAPSVTETSSKSEKVGQMRSDSMATSRPSTMISLTKKPDARQQLRPILKKTVSFTPSAKESSPDVTSTSNIPDVTLESDRLALRRKQSALARLGPMSNEPTANKPSSSSSVGDRKQLLITRIGDRKVVVQKPPGITSRLGPKKVEVAEASSTSTGSVFSRLGRK